MEVRFLPFLRSCVEVLSKRGSILAFFNVTYFCSFFVVVLLAHFLLPPVLYSEEPLTGFWFPIEDSWFITFVVIFLFNLVVSAFIVVTLPGMVLFPLSAGFLVFRGVLWGLLFYPLPAWSFLVVLPTVILEGEAYIMAAAAGTVVGLSWVKSGWLFKNKELSRVEAFKLALKEVRQLYKVVVMLLLVAAVVETVTILSI